MELVPVNNTFINSSFDQKRESNISVKEVYLDGKLKKAECINDDEKSFGIFMHSLILSNYVEVMKVNNSQVRVIGDEYEKAIFNYTASKGFDKMLIESIAPRVEGLNFECDNENKSKSKSESINDIKVSAHIINEKIRIISKGTPDNLLKRCSFILLDSKFVKMTRRIYRDINYVLRDMIKRCVNVYAIAIKDMAKIVESLNYDMYVDDMALVALVGMGC